MLNYMLDQLYAQFITSTSLNHNVFSENIETKRDKTRRDEKLSNYRGFSPFFLSLFDNFSLTNFVGRGTYGRANNDFCHNFLHDRLIVMAAFVGKHLVTPVSVRLLSEVFQSLQPRMTWPGWSRAKHKANA